MQLATFAAGCFWSVEFHFQHLPGVLNTTVGYAGGHLDNPTYEQVCSGKTGHAEAVSIEFDENKLTYEMLLEEFWQIHDPTLKDRQGPDVGHQYRSAIFYHNTQQQLAAETFKKKLAETGQYTKPILTEITPATKFYPAELYHQHYFEKKGRL